jgi:hypothetical protein
MPRDFMFLMFYVAHSACLAGKFFFLSEYRKEIFLQWRAFLGERLTAKCFNFVHYVLYFIYTSDYQLVAHRCVLCGLNTFTVI